MVMGGNIVKVISWYDNEWGYSCRVRLIDARSRRYVGRAPVPRVADPLPATATS